MTVHVAHGALWVMSTSSISCCGDIHGLSVESSRSSRVSKGASLSALCHDWPRIWSSSLSVSKPGGREEGQRCRMGWELGKVSIRSAYLRWWWVSLRSVGTIAGFDSKAAMGVVLKAPRIDLIAPFCTVTSFEIEVFCPI